MEEIIKKIKDIQVELSSVSTDLASVRDGFYMEVLDEQVDRLSECIKNLEDKGEFEFYWQT